MPYPFLSPEWIEAAKELRGEYAGRVPSTAVSARMNETVTDVPFGDGTVEAHIETSPDTISIDLGHLDKPDVTISLGYDTAKAIFIDGRYDIAMEAFLGGRIKTTGDLTKLLGLQASVAGATGDSELKALADELSQRLRDITI